MKTKDGTKTINVFIGQRWEAALIKYLLEKGGIKSSLRNDNTKAADPSNKPGGTWDIVTLVVSVTDWRKAKLILAKYEMESATSDLSHSQDILKGLRTIPRKKR